MAESRNSSIKLRKKSKSRLNLTNTGHYDMATIKNSTITPSLSTSKKIVTAYSPLTTLNKFQSASLANPHKVTNNLK